MKEKAFQRAALQRIHMILKVERDGKQEQLDEAAHEGQTNCCINIAYQIDEIQKALDTMTEIMEVL